jgi:hypothetical protein
MIENWVRDVERLNYDDRGQLAHVVGVAEALMSVLAADVFARIRERGAPE